jgi:hypothetical protein
MKKLLALCLLLPLFGLSQTKNVVSVTRVFPKIDKVGEFEKALTAHAQKYHTGDWKWRVFTIESGPDAGGYHITEGPVSWEQIDGRGDLGQAHTDDWNKNVAVFLTDKYQSSYSVFREDLSTVQLTDYSDKIAILHIFPKPGFGLKMEEHIKIVKKAWEIGKETVAVYQASSSGPSQFALVSRYKQGLKERATGFRKPFNERYEEANGAGSYNNYVENVSKYTDNSWSELLFYKKELSSK